MRKTATRAAALLLSAALSASAAGVPAPGALTNIGVAAAVRGAVSARAPGAPAGRVVGSGKPVFLNDHVATGPDARLQILLLDETTFTIGPNSDMVLDEFVYDPASGAGKVTAEITKGAFRFVTGKVARRKPEDMQVKIPVGTIGIRGTMVEGAVDGLNADILLAGPGPDNNAQERPGGITVTTAGGSTDIDSSGYGTSIRGGGAPSAGYRFAPDQVGGIHARLFGDAGGASDGGGGAARTASATQSSGQGAASGGVNFQTTASDVVAQNNDTANFAAQQRRAGGGLYPDGTSSWSDMVAANTPTGFGSYSNSGTYSCSGGVCGGGATGSFNMKVAVDFVNHVVGGNGSLIQITGGALSSLTTGTSIFGVAYGSTGQAITSFSGGSLGDANFAGSNIAFQNANHVPGARAVMTMSYSNTQMGVTAGGQVTGQKQTMSPP